MTNFATEEYLITHIALGFDDVPLTEDDVPSVLVTVYAVGEAVDDEPAPWDPLPSVTNIPMTWNPTAAWSIRVGNRTITGEGWWQYLWNTTGVEAGTYQAKVVLIGISGGKNAEFLRIRLKAPRVAI